LSLSCNIRGLAWQYAAELCGSAYNEEAYLPACLESILAQTGELGDAVEIIVVNNASSDRTLQVAMASRACACGRAAQGVDVCAAGRIRASSGELIANVDSDSRLTEAG